MPFRGKLKIYLRGDPSTLINPMVSRQYSVSSATNRVFRNNVGIALRDPGCSGDVEMAKKCHPDITPGWWRRSRRRGRQKMTSVPCYHGGAHCCRDQSDQGHCACHPLQIIKCFEDQDFISSGDTGEDHQDDHVCQVVPVGSSW